MSLAGVGTDICEVARIERVLARFGARFVNRILTPDERPQKVWRADRLARRWALKEAVAKALGTGIGAAVGFQDITITPTAKGDTLCTVRTRPDLRFWVSVSDDGGYALAFCVAEVREGA